MRLPSDQPEALKAEAEKLGMPHTRLARRFIKDGLRSTKG